MIPKKTLAHLLNENRLDDLIDHIEEDDFPPDEYDFEEAQELRRTKSSLLALLRDLRERAEKVGPSRVEDENFRSIKESLYELLEVYADSRTRVILHMFERYVFLREKSEKDERVKIQLEMKRLNLLKRNANREIMLLRDALIIAMAEGSGMPSINKQAAYVHKYWGDNEELVDLRKEPLSEDRIRKIMASAPSGPT